MMYYLESGMKNVPNLTLSNVSAYKDLFSKLFIEGFEPFKPDAIEGQKLIFNSGMVTHDLAKFVIYDSKNSIITKIKKLSNNEFVAVEDISSISADDLMITYPRPNNFILNNNGDGFSLENDFGGFEIAKFPSSQRVNNKVYRSMSSSIFGFGNIYTNSGFKIIYGENGFVIINNQNGEECFFIMLITKDLTVFSNENSQGGYSGWGQSNIVGISDINGSSKLSLFGAGNVNIANNPLCIAPVYFGGYPSPVLRNTFGSIVIPSVKGVFERLPIEEALGDYAIVKNNKGEHMVLYLGDE